MVVVVLFSGPAFNGLRFLAGKFELAFVYHRLERFHNAYIDYVRLPSALFIAFLTGVIVQLNGIIVVYLLSRALGLEIDFAAFLIFVPLTSAIAKIPVTFGGLGLREGSYVLLFGYIGVAPSQSVAPLASDFCNHPVFRLYRRSSILVFWRSRREIFT